MVIEVQGALMSNPNYHLAQLNIARLVAPIDSPVLADFVALLDEINQLADHSPGFVWRLQSSDGNATSIRPFDDDYILVNMSVWESIEQLGAYVYKSAHSAVMRRRREWFEPMKNGYIALWWVPAGHLPTVAEAKGRLELLRTHGDTAAAFTFKRPFAAPQSSAVFQA
jgi:hypothetical protein